MKQGRLGNLLHIITHLFRSGDTIDRCPWCTREVRQGWRICPYCRGSLRGDGAGPDVPLHGRPVSVRFCAQCGAASPTPGGNYCQSCGFRLGAAPSENGSRLIPPPLDPYPHTHRPPAQRRSRAPLLLAVVLLLIFLAGSVMLLTAIAQEPAGNIPTLAAPAAAKLVATPSPTPADPTMVTGSLPYVLRGGVLDGGGSIPFQLRRSAYQAVAGKTLPFYGDNQQYYLQILNDPVQRPELAALAEEIRSIADDPDDQARIAISAVQHIPYDTAKAELDAGDRRERYPLEVLYDNEGLCGEKSVLLASLLRDLGFGVALFEFKYEQHMAVGITCPAGYDFAGTGYAFVESTSPAIMTDSSGTYTGVGRLTYVPEVIPIASGAAFSGISEEAADAREWRTLQSMGRTLDEYHYTQYVLLKKKYGLGTDSGQGT